MTARLLLGERPHLMAPTCTFTTKGAYQAPAFMKWVTNFLEDYWAFILAFSQTAWKPLRMGLYDRRFTIGDGRASPRS